MIYLKKILLILFTCILIICGIYIFLFGTKIGVNLIFKGITYYIPGLSIESVSGSWGDFNINHLIYSLPSGIIKINKLCLSINLKYIFIQQINVEHLLLKEVFIKKNNSAIIPHEKINNPKTKTNNFYLNLYPIVIKNIVLNDIHIVSNNFELQFQKLNFGLNFQNNLLKIFSAYLEEGSIIHKSSIHLLQKTFNTQIIQAIPFIKEYSNLKYKFNYCINTILKKIYTSKNAMPINVILQDFQGKNLNIYNNSYSKYSTINDFQIQCSWNTKMMDIALTLNFPDRKFRVIGNVLYSNNYPIDFVINYFKTNNTNVDNYETSHRNLKKINLFIKGNLIKTVCTRFDFYDFVSIIHAIFKIKLISHKTPIDLLIIGKNISIPVLNKRSCFLETINLHIVGSLYDSYCVRIKTELICPDIPNVYISLCAQGNMRQCTISELKLKILNRHCNINR